MQKERNYQFRERLLQIHKPNRRMEYAVCGAGQIEVTDAWSIWIPHTEDRVLYNAARDLLDYFAVSMGLSLRLQVGGELPAKAIVYDHHADLKENQYRLLVEETCILLAGAEARYAAQAGYFLEDLMNLAEGPFLDLQDMVHTPLYDTRMTHSGYGLDQFPDQHIQALAHAGFTALLLFVRGLNQSDHGYQDFNDLIYRAAGYGMDVYVSVS